MKLEEINKWIESDQYKKILDILEKAPQLIRTLRDLGVFQKDNGTDFIDYKKIDFRPIHDKNNQICYDLIIKNGTKIVKSIPWTELAQYGVNPVSLATLGISIHNAIMLHKISHQLEKLSEKTEEILDGLESDREAGCKAALGQLKAAKDYWNDKQMAKPMLANALKDALLGYNSIKPIFFNTQNKLIETNDSLKALLDKGIYSRGQYLVKKFLLIGEPLVEWGVDKYKTTKFVGDVKKKQAAFEKYVSDFQNQWGYLYLATYVQIMVHLLNGKQDVINSCLHNFRTEIFEEINLGNISGAKEIKKQFGKQLRDLELLQVK